MQVRVTSSRFPRGTVVGLYRRADGPPALQHSSSYAPGTPLDTATMEEDGALFTGLEADNGYWAAAQVDGAWRWVGVRSEASSGDVFASEDPEDTPYVLDVPADQTGDVFLLRKGGVDLVSIDADGVLHLSGVGTDDGDLALRSRLPFNVKDYGATGDGTTDDSAAVQATIDAAAAAGGGIVFFPRGTYLCNTRGGIAYGLSWILSITDDRIHLVGEGAGLTTIKTTNIADRLLFIAGSGKPEGPANWLKYAPWRFSGDTYASGAAIAPACPYTLRTIAAAARGAQSVTCVTPAHAGDFAAGDYVAIRTGQTVVNAGNWNAEPDSEYNRVISANAGTGVVVLERPLAKPYAQERQGAIGQASTTSPAAVDTPLGIVKLTQAVIEDIAVTDMSLEANAVGAQPVFCIRGVVSGLRQERLKIVCATTPQDTLEYRDAVFRDLLVFMTGTARDDHWPVAVAVGCTDVEIENVTGIATKKMCTLHIHEGSSRVKARGVRLFSGGGAAGIYSISIRARAYDVQIDDYTIVGQGSVTAIIIGSTESGGGRIGRGHIRGSWTRSILCQSSGWEIAPPEDGRGGDVQISTVRASLVPTEVRALMAWVSDDAQTVTLGELPAQAVILSARVHVFEVFDSDAADGITVGFDTWHDGFGQSVDAAVLGVHDAPDGGARGYIAVPRTAIAYYVNAGSEPTTGKALVVVEYATGITAVA